MTLVLDLETAPNPDAPVSPVPDDWLGKGVKDNFKPDTLAKYHEANTASWPAEYRKRASLDWRLGRIVAAGIYDGAEKYLLTAWEPKDEPTLLYELWSGIEHGTVVGYNIRSFDLPWLVGRSLVLGVAPSRHLSQVPKWKTETVVDLFDLLNPYGKPWWTLDAYAKLLNLPHQPIGAGAEVAQWVEAGQTDAVLTHLEADLLTTWDLYQRCRSAFGV